VSVHDYVIANGTGSAVRSDLNNALAAIVSLNSSSTEPSTTYAYQLWADTNTNTLKIRNSANSAWVAISSTGGIGSANLGLAPLASPSFTGTSSFAGNINMTGTGAIDVAAGTAAQRPGTPSAGMIRFNTDDTTFEGYNGSAWGALGGGGGMTSPSSVSPSGLSQVAPEPERERADSGQTVFNINFGGSIVYDTKQAAERAFADRITQLQNVRRRGAPRRSF